MRVRKRWPASIEQRCRTSPWTILLFLSLEKHQIQGFCPVQLAFEVKKKTNTKSSDNDVAQSSIMNDDEPCEMARVENHFKCRKLIYIDLQIHICIYVHMLVVICQNYKFVFFFFIYMRFLHWIWYSLHFLLILFFLYCSLKFYQYQYFMVLYQFLNMWIFIFFIYFVIIFSI